MAKLFEYQQRVERMYYRHGLFMSNNPVIMICISAVVMLLCCYPLLNLPLPGSEPTEFLNPLSDFKQSTYIAGKSLPYQHHHLGVNVDLPAWFQADKQVAYIQQLIVKSVVNPWDEKEMITADVYRAPLSKLFTLLEEIENFHLEEDSERHSVVKECLHVSETIIKQGQGIKPLFPEYGCLILSPALFWKKNIQEFRKDPNVVHTVHKYQGKTIETSPSIKELLFGVPSKESGVHNFIVKNRQRVVTYAITVILKSYDSQMITKLREKIQAQYPSATPDSGRKKCAPGTEGSNCENSSDSGGDVPVITHIHFKSQIGVNELIPLLSTYFIMGCYIYFSVRKINFVKSKLGMAFSAVVSIMASLMMSVGLCSLFGLTPTLNGGEIFPYLVIVIGLENILVIMKSVVATPMHLDVDKRVALGLSREGCSITKNLLLELVLIGLGYFTYVPEIQEFCAFAVVGIVSDYFMQMIFFTTVLSIDIRRLDITEEMYSHSNGSESDEEGSREHKSWLDFTRRKSSVPGTRSISILEQWRSTYRNKRSGKLDGYHKVEAGGKSVPILKIPKRLQVLFFWADTRMVQRGLMVFMVIWFALLMYGDPFGSMNTDLPVTPAPNQYRTATLAPILQPTKEPTFSIFRQEKKTKTPESVDSEGNLLWYKEDMQLYRRLSFRHWPTLFAYYNLTLAGKFVSILPPIPLSVTITPKEAIETRHSSDASKHASKSAGVADPSSSEMAQHEDNMGQQLPPYSYTGRYPMTGLDYYLTLLLGAVSGMMMVFLLTVMYRCVCTRNYGRRSRKDRSASSCGDSMPLVLMGHPQLVECITSDESLLVSADLSGELRVWDIHSGDCSCVIHRVTSPVPERFPGEGAIDAKPTPIGYQETDNLYPSTFINSYHDVKDTSPMGPIHPALTEFHVESSLDAPDFRKGHSRQRSWHSTHTPQRTHRRSGSGGDVSGGVTGRHVSANIASLLSPFSPTINLSPTIQTDFAQIARERKGHADSGLMRKRIVTSEFNPPLPVTPMTSRHSSRGNLELGGGDDSPIRKSSDDSSYLQDEDVDAPRAFDFKGIFHQHYVEHLELQCAPLLKETAHNYPYPTSDMHPSLARNQSLPSRGNSANPKMTYSAQPSGAWTLPVVQQPQLLNRPEISGRYCSYPASMPPTSVGVGNRGSLEDNMLNMWGSWESGLGPTTPHSGPASWGSMPDSPVEMENGPSVWCLVCVRSFVITGCENGRIEVWDTKSGVLKCSHDVGKAGVVALVAEESKLVAARVNGSLDFFSMEATFFHPAPVQYRGPPRMRHDSDKALQDMMCSDVLTLQLVYTVKSAHQQTITAFKMAMGRVMTGSCDHTLKVFTVQDARCLSTLFGHGAAVTALHMDKGAPAGAASGDSDGTVRLWDLPTGGCLHKLDEHKGEVTAIQCSESHIVSAAQDDKLCVWARRSGMLLHVRCLDPGCSNGMCLLGSSWCVTGGLGCVLLWDMRNGDLVRRIRLSDESSGPAARVTQLLPVANLSVACDIGKELRIVRFPSVLEKID